MGSYPKGLKMKEAKNWFRAVALGALMLSTLIACRPALSQQNNGNDLANKKVTLNLTNADIRSALQLLFNTVGVNYSLDSNVRGTVTVSLNDTPFQTALESILRSSSMIPLTYRVENGVYNISVKQEDNNNVQQPYQASDNTNTPATEVQMPKRFTKIPVNFADAGEIALLMGGTPIISEYYSTAGMMGMTSMGGGGMGGYGGGFGNNMYGGGGYGGGMGGFGGGMGGFGGGMGGFGGGMGGFGGGIGGFGGGMGGYGGYGGGMGGFGNSSYGGLGNGYRGY
jgi:hypothetical protein